MHDYGVIKLSESLIFLGFSMLLEFDLMGVIWGKFLRNEIIENVVFSMV